MKIRHFRSHHFATLALMALAFSAVSIVPTHAYAQDADAPAPQDKPQPPKVGEIAPDFELQDLGGEKVKLSEQTAKGPVVLIELRGFPGYQCPFCTAQVGQLLGKAKEFSEAKSQVVFVYPGPADGLKAHTDEFVRGKDIPANFHLLLDPDFAMTKQYGLRWEGQNETSYPSTFVLDTKRKVLFAKVSHTHGDRSTVEEILAALPKAP